MKYLLCKTTQLDASRGFELELNGQDLSLLLIRDQSTIRAYLNRCPHTGVELNWLPDQFLDLDGQFIQCATHDARFRLQDGYCVAGPFAGQSLQSLSVNIEDGEIYLQLPNPRPN